MTSLLVLPHICISQVPAPNLPPVVVTERPLSDEDRNALWSVPWTDAIVRYRARGYELVDANGVSFLFSPKLWATKEIADRLAIWSELAKSVGTDGTVDLAKAPTVRKLAEAGLGEMMGFSGVSEANLMLQSTPSITIGDGKRSVEVPLSGSGTPAGRQRLRERPMRRIEPPKGKTVAPKEPPVVPGVLATGDSLCIFAPRSRFGNARNIAVLASASKLLAERYGEARDRVVALEGELRRRIPDADPAQDATLGSRVGNLPEGLQRVFSDNFVASYAKYGFASKEAADAWLTTARVTGKNLQWSITGAWDSGMPTPSYAGFGLP